MPTIVELAIQRGLTKAFIDADPVSIVLSRVTRTPLSTGGWKETLAPLAAAQTFRIIPASDRNITLRDSDGQIVSPAFTLLGEWNADLKRNDRFAFGDVNYQVLGPVRPEHTAFPVYRKGDVIRLG